MVKNKLEETLINISENYKELISNPNFFKERKKVKNLYLESMNQLIDSVKSKNFVYLNTDLSNLNVNEENFSYTFKPLIIRKYEREKILEYKESIHSIEFDSLYPNILLKLSKLGVITFNDLDFKEVIIHLIENKNYYKTKNANLYKLVKILINYTYTALVTKKSDVFYNVTNFNLIATHTSSIFDTLIQDTNCVISIYIDTIYVKKYEENKKLINGILKKLELPYEIKKIN